GRNWVRLVGAMVGVGGKGNGVGGCVPARAGQVDVAPAVVEQAHDGAAHRRNLVQAGGTAVVPRVPEREQNGCAVGREGRVLRAVGSRGGVKPAHDVIAALTRATRPAAAPTAGPAPHAAHPPARPPPAAGTARPPRPARARRAARPTRAARAARAAGAGTGCVALSSSVAWSRPVRTFGHAAAAAYQRRDLPAERPQNCHG